MTTERHLLLLGGMMCDQRVWKHQLQELAGGFDSIQVADLTGSDSIQRLAASALAAAPDRFVLAGLSLGGIVAFECFRQAPGRITHLVLLDTNPFAEKPERQALRDPEIRRAVSGELREMMVDGFKPAYLGSRCRDDQAMLGEILDMAMDLGPGVFARQSVALRDRPDSSATLDRIQCPTAVVCGAEDVLCPLAYHQFMAAHIPSASLTALEGCGHLAPLESPGEVNRIILELSEKPSESTHETKH